MDGFTAWFTGLPSSGKSTLGLMLQDAITRCGLNAEVLDGDEFRARISRGLGFSREDRDENIRRIAYVAKLLSRNGVVAITCAISPYRALRAEARVEIGRFVEIFVCCPVEECIHRDAKGLYKKALAGEISQFTGVSDPYEEPLDPEIIVDTHRNTPQECTLQILHRLRELDYLPPEGSVLTDVLVPSNLLQRPGAR